MNEFFEKSPGGHRPKRKKIVILSGAGISAESGVSTFRDSDGLWENHDVMEVASVLGWKKNPGLVLEFYNGLRAQLVGVRPAASLWRYAPAGCSSQKNYSAEKCRKSRFLFVVFCRKSQFFNCPWICPPLCAVSPETRYSPDALSQARAAEFRRLDGRFCRGEDRNSARRTHRP